MSELQAPCVAIVGPANSGKTTLLHLLDRALQRHPSRLLSYVVKGNPDGTGRYQFYNPALRESLKPRVKGAWNGNPTIEQIIAWTRNARRHLDLALLDFGGRHNPENYRMLRECSHYIAVVRDKFDGAGDEAANGMDSWRAAATDAGLIPLAEIRSFWKEGEVSVDPALDPLVATLRSDANKPEDSVNQPLVAALIERLVALRLPGRVPGYENLNIGRWDPADVDAALIPLSDRLRHLARSDAPVRLGGAAPVFGYLRAMHVALDQNSETAIETFDPKFGFVPIPPRGLRQDEFPATVLFEIDQSAENTVRCEVQIVSVDRFLPFSAAEYLDYAPRVPAEALTARRVVMSGVLPIWLHAAYSRWLRTAGVPEVGVWDANSGLDVIVHRQR